ncbi:MAG TPA: alpha/beta fold hydrolase [Acidimicrobiales bacterium]|nr:alpha/beta fold hydrolase [Acidimicrobiales bacterium]
MATMVLVHGGWMGGWSWREVAPRLRRMGHEVHTPTLTGLGDRVHLLSGEVSAATHARDVADTLHFEDAGDAVLVGHSYAGVVITLAAERCPERIGHLVYLDAMVPADGQRLVDLMPPEAVQWIRSQRRGSVWTHPPMAMDLDGPGGADASWFTDRLVPQPANDVEVPIRLPSRAAERLRRTYVACTGSTLNALFAGVVAGPGWERRELPTGHFPMLTDPDALAALLDDLA